MNDARPMTSPATEGRPSDADLPTKASLGRVLLDQKKTIAVALVLVVAQPWLVARLGVRERDGDHERSPLLRAAITGSGVYGGYFGAGQGILLIALLGIITSGAQPTRGQMIASTLLRLGALTVVAVGAAILFWPNGIGLLLGLAIFRLIALVMTGLPLLKELKQG